MEVIFRVKELFVSGRVLQIVFVKYLIEWIIIYLIKINKFVCLKNRWFYFLIIFEDIKYIDRIYLSFLFKWYFILCLSFKEVNVFVFRLVE